MNSLPTILRLEVTAVGRGWTHDDDGDWHSGEGLVVSGPRWWLPGEIDPREAKNYRWALIAALAHSPKRASE